MKLKSSKKFEIEILNDKVNMVFECGCRSSFFNDFVKANDAKMSQIELDIGYCSYIEDHSELRFYSCATSEYKFKIGNYTSVGNNTFFIMNGGHRTNYLSTHKFFRYFELPSKEWECVDNLENKGIEIGSDVWIGAHSKILSGSRIADGVVLGTDTLVTSSQTLEPFGIYVGHPAKLIKFRYHEDIIEKLLELRWWQKDLKWAKNNSILFDFDLNKDVSKTLDILEEVINES